MTPFFSIVVPVYNTELFLDECINSVIKQDFENWELILIDDGSIDKSGLICDNYAASDKRIKVIHTNNNGQFIARKHGIEHASGIHLLFLDSDDFLELNALSTLYSFLKDFNPDLILYDAYHFLNNKQELSEDNIDFFGEFTDKREILKQCFLKRTSRISMCSYCFKRELFVSCFDNLDSTYTIRSNEDFLMVYQLVKKANSLLVINKILYNYRQNSQSTSHNLDVEHFYGGLLINSNIYHNLVNEFNFDIKREFDNYIFKRLSWLPMSYLIRCSLINTRKEFKAHFKLIKTNFLFIHFTKHYRFPGKSYRLFLFLLNTHLFLFARMVGKMIGSKNGK